MSSPLAVTSLDELKASIVEEDHYGNTPVLDAARRVVALLETLKADEQISELVLRRFLLGEPR